MNTTFSIAFPGPVLAILARLEAHGHQAWAVGGCVRDALLGRAVHDWDLCTSATPAEMLRAFSGWPVRGAGLRHGTLTVVLGGAGYEVTTCRVDGPYTDGRRPDAVRFTRSLQEDLARRDLTINAMAFHPRAGLCDPFGGMADLRRGLVRCVGAPALRFAEDELRLLRALRFAAVLNFSIHPATAAAIHAQCAGPALRRTAPQRLLAELLALLPGSGVLAVLLEYPDVLAQFIPEIAATVGFEQHNPYHIYPVWEHIARAVAAAPPEAEVRLALLLHDIAKPVCFSQDAAGNGHFYGHAQRGKAMAAQILQRLCYPGQLAQATARLVGWHDTPLAANPAAVRRWLNRAGEQQFRRLICMHRCDALAKAPAPCAGRLRQLDDVERLLDTLVAQRACFCLKHLAVNGRDALAAGIPRGPQVGAALNTVLDAVLDGRLPNSRPRLLEELRALAQTPSSP